MSVFDASIIQSSGTKLHISPNLPPTNEAEDWEDITGWLDIPKIVSAVEIGGSTNIESEASLDDGYLQKWAGVSDAGDIALELQDQTTMPEGTALLRTFAKDPAKKGKQAAFRITLVNGRKIYFAAIVAGWRTTIAQAGGRVGITTNLGLSKEPVEVEPS